MDEMIISEVIFTNMLKAMLRNYAYRNKNEVPSAIVIPPIFEVSNVPVKFPTEEDLHSWEDRVREAKEEQARLEAEAQAQAEAEEKAKVEEEQALADEEDKIQGNESGGEEVVAEIPGEVQQEEEEAR